MNSLVCVCVRCGKADTSVQRQADGVFRCSGGCRSELPVIQGIVIDAEVQTRNTCQCGATYWLDASDYELCGYLEYLCPKCNEDLDDFPDDENVDDPPDSYATSFTQPNTASTSLTRSEPALQPIELPAPRLPQVYSPAIPIDHKSFFNDIKYLLEDATAPIVDRPQTFWQRIFQGDPITEQIAAKMRAAETADQLILARTELVEHWRQLTHAFTDTQLDALEARAEILEAQLRLVDLENEIRERQALSESRIRNQYVAEQLEMESRRAAMVPIEQVDERELEIQEHRRDRLARARANQAVLADFLNEIRLICQSRVSNHVKALQIREMLSAYEMPEENLPNEARWILDTGERTRYGA